MGETRRKQRPPPERTAMSESEMIEEAADLIYTETWYLSIEHCQAIARDIIQLVRETT